MPNYSDLSLALSGNLFLVKAAQDKFNSAEIHSMNISEIYENIIMDNPLSTGTATWALNGSGRWGVDIETLVEFLSEFNLSGTITDAEPGSDFFIEVELLDGVVDYHYSTNYMSDEHYAHSPDNRWWQDSYYYALETPEDYPEIIKFLIKHEIITEEDLHEQS